MTMDDENISSLMRSTATLLVLLMLLAFVLG